ncbi:MAG TPA: EAL domain-containing protein [Burkholderiaceae bacterium]|jgi:EAL and modified HD-GYP domain-containing signal transduction protein
MTDQSFDPAIDGQQLKEFFLARQPILNRDQNLIAYELLFRGAAHGAANVIDDLSATASVMAHVSELGLENVVGESVGFLNVDATVLMSDFISFLPAHKVILEILETVKVTPEILARVEELIKAGYTFALDDVIADSADIQQLLPLIQIIKIDIMGMDKADLLGLSRQFKSTNKKMLAEKVETLEEFELCMQLGFDYFQGYYFARPVILSGKKLTPSQLSILQLINQIIADAETVEIERTIKTDASLGLNLLRLVNSPGIGATQRIESLNQALLVLGRVQLQRWLQILLYANHGKSSTIMSPLLMLATTRGKLLELMAQKLQPGNRSVADKSFTVGIMSLMDTLFGQSMEKILEQIAVADEVREALLFRKGTYGDMLKLAEYVERLDDAGPLLLPTLEKLKLSPEDFSALQLTAFQWASNVGSGSK